MVVMFDHLVNAKFAKFRCNGSTKRFDVDKTTKQNKTENLTRITSCCLYHI